jgi:hypothetical protein
MDCDYCHSAPIVESGGTGASDYTREVTCVGSKHLNEKHWRLWLSRSNDELRLAQLNEVDDARVYDSTQLVVVAGDLNLNASKSVITDALARAGFRVVVPTSRVPTTPARHLLEDGSHIDWAFVCGPVQTDAGKVHVSQPCFTATGATPKQLGNTVRVSEQPATVLSLISVQ